MDQWYQNNRTGYQLDYDFVATSRTKMLTIFQNLADALFPQNCWKARRQIDCKNWVDVSWSNCVPVQKSPSQSAFQPNNLHIQPNNPKSPMCICLVKTSLDNSFLFLCIQRARAARSFSTQFPNPLESLKEHFIYCIANFPLKTPSKVKGLPFQINTLLDLSLLIGPKWKPWHFCHNFSL